MTRPEALEEAIASLRLEGLVPSPLGMQLLKEWADHRMSASEVIAAIVRLPKHDGRSPNSKH